MENNVENNKESRKLGGVTGKGFMPGVSGNPGGRPKDTLKAFIAREFRNMDDNGKREWLKTHKITGDLMWRMGEGNPATNMEISGELTSKVISVDD